MCFCGRMVELKRVNVGTHPLGDCLSRVKQYIKKNCSPSDATTHPCMHAGFGEQMKIEGLGLCACMGLIRAQ